jgi:hypothetical protein
MADYREISQSYAQGAIKAVILINSGALVACLSQLSSLFAHLDGLVLGAAFFCWIFGIVLGVAAWGFGFLSTRYVDISERGSPEEIRISNRWLRLGFAAFVLATVAFPVGAMLLVFKLVSQ